MKYFLAGAVLFLLACTAESRRNAVTADTVSAETSATNSVAPDSQSVTLAETAAVNPVASAELPSASVHTRPYRRSWLVGAFASRFRASGLRYADGRLLLFLDTARDTHVDSLTVNNLGARESFATLCRLTSGSDADSRLAAIMRDSVHEQWLKPRLAWMFDTVSRHIRPIVPDSASCMLETAD